MSSAKNIQFLAYYLPQFHPIPENDLWWGKGFTEWTNVAKAKPLFKGHYQPILPADLGFYDLRVPEVQEEQSKFALEYGIDGFIYYQYWFGNGKMLLEKPAEKMLANPNVKIPFCFCWANETWKGIWHGLDNPDVLIEQTYQGEKGYIEYFEYLLPFFKDDRYIKKTNKPMFHIHRIDDIPDLDLFLNTFNRLAIENGFEGIHFIVTHGNSQTVISKPEIFGQVGIDVFNNMRYQQSYVFSLKTFLGKVERILFEKFSISWLKRNPFIIDYKIATEKLTHNFTHKKYIPCVFPNWDNSARSGKKALIFKNATPQLWKAHLSKTLMHVKKQEDTPEFIIIKSWNEWAEGNYLEPDIKYGNQWLKAIKEVKDECFYE
jgi:lipopolysaccharide biosynthesis protein